MSIIGSPLLDRERYCVPRQYAEGRSRSSWSGLVHDRAVRKGIPWPGQLYSNEINRRGGLEESSLIRWWLEPSSQS